MMFHHDPLHSDEFLDDFGAAARTAWARVSAATRRSSSSRPRAREVDVGTTATVPTVHA